MSDTRTRRLLGLQRLVEDAVEHGATAVERVHRQTADRTFTVLEAIPPLAEPARLVHGVYGLVLSGSYGGVRAVNRAVGAVLHAVIEGAGRASSSSRSFVASD